MGKRQLVSPGEILQKNISLKEELRKKTANLPFSDKIKIVIELQKISKSAAKAGGRTFSHRIWKID